MMRKIFIYLSFIFLTFLITNKAFAIGPDVFVQSTVNRAAEALGGNASIEEKVQILKDIANETVDVRGIGFYSLGAHRKGLSKDQLNEYEKVFTEYFLKSFSSRLSEYSNPMIKVNSKKKINDNYTIVSSTLVATDTRPEVKIDWRIYTKNPDNLLIRDLIIEGLSLARTQKEEFSSIINSNDGKIEALLKNLSDFVIK
jgi:phospholipid transport system substrate-binding protein